jgi:transposase
MTCDVATLAQRCRRGGVHPINLPAHKGPQVEELIKAAGARLLYLPPYSPDFNPIENAFSKLKALLRKAAERSVDGLWAKVGELLVEFTPKECANFFAAAGYEPV